MRRATTIDDLEPTDWSSRIDEFHASGLPYGEAVNRVLSNWTRSDVDPSRSCIETRYIHRMDGRAMR